MVKIIEKFIEHNLDLIDTENWEALLDKMVEDLPNPRIQECFDIFEEADIEIDELCMVRTHRLIDAINSIFKSLAPNRYNPYEIIVANPSDWYGNTLSDLIYFIYYNQDFWPDNLEFIDMGYEKDPEYGDYIIVVN